jgi:hypothetical protein
LLANFVFHFVFAIFTIWLGVSWFLAQQRFLALKKSLIPLLCLEKITFPTHRSLVVQSIKALEIELQDTFQKKVCICFPIENAKEYNYNPFKTFALFFTKGNFNQSKNLEHHNQMYAASEFAVKMKEDNKAKKIIFTFKNNSNQTTIWNVEIL